MQHIDIINRIMDAERKARTIAGEAGKELGELDAKLAAEKAAMRASFIEHAEKHIALVAESEKRFADESVAKMEEELRESIRAYRESALRNGEVWADRLFRKVTDISELLP